MKGANFITSSYVNYVSNTGNLENNYYSYRESNKNEELLLPFKVCLTKQIYNTEKIEQNQLMLCVQYENIITGNNNESLSLCIDLFVNNIKNCYSLKLLQ